MGNLKGSRSRPSHEAEKLQLRIRVSLNSLRKKGWGIGFRTRDAQGKLIRSRNARKRRTTGSGVQLRECGAADRSGASIAADSSDDGCGVTRVVGGVRWTVCARRAAVG